MQRPGEQASASACSTIMPRYMHRDAMAEEAHGAEVVRDEKVGGAAVRAAVGCSRSTISARAVGSSAEVGSSSTISSGSVMMARAMPTRCCCPALSSAGKCVEQVVRRGPAAPAPRARGRSRSARVDAEIAQRLADRSRRCACADRATRPAPGTRAGCVPRSSRSGCRGRAPSMSCRGTGCRRRSVRSGPRRSGRPWSCRSRFRRPAPGSRRARS